MFLVWLVSSKSVVVCLFESVPTWVLNRDGITRHWQQCNRILCISWHFFHNDNKRNEDVVSSYYGKYLSCDTDHWPNTLKIKYDPSISQGLNKFKVMSNLDESSILKSNMSPMLQIGIQKNERTDGAFTGSVLIFLCNIQ